MTSVSQALKSLRPTSEFICIGEDFYTVIWKDKENIKPTKDEVDAEITRLKNLWINTDYQRLRKKEYPSVTDYLDAVVKGDLEQQQAYIDACQAVKAKYPKPEGV